MDKEEGQLQQRPIATMLCPSASHLLCHVDLMQGPSTPVAPRLGMVSHKLRPLTVDFNELAVEKRVTRDVIIICYMDRWNHHVNSSIFWLENSKIVLTPLAIDTFRALLFCVISAFGKAERPTGRFGT